MTAYVIVAHQEFECIPELLKGIYGAEDIYCICVNVAAIGSAVVELHMLRALPNIHLISVPPTSWGGFVTEAYLYGIDFCLRYDLDWTELIILTNTDFPLVSREIMKQKIAGPYQNKIVLHAFERPIELDGDIQLQKRLLSQPFRELGADMAQYNPFTHLKVFLEREGVEYLIEPDGMYPAWTEKSTFFRNLFKQQNFWQERRVVGGKQNSIIRKFLAKFFEVNVSGHADIWGIFPRDFASYCVNDISALSYFSAVHSAFSLEEIFFPTIALNEPFTERVICQKITHSIAAVDARLGIEHVDPNVVGDCLFARKVPRGPEKFEFYRHVYSTFGIEEQPQISEICDGRIGADAEALAKTLRDHVRFSGSKFAFGFLGNKYFYDVTLSGDGALVYDKAHPQPLGDTWRWSGPELLMLTAQGEIFCRFDSFRVHGGSFLAFGSYLHFPAVVLTLQSEMNEVLCSCPSRVEMSTRYGVEVNLTVKSWSFWFSDVEGAKIKFAVDGTIAYDVGSEESAGYWRIDDGRLVAFGLHDMPIAILDQVSVAHGRAQIAGASWGRDAAVQPCFLREIL